MARSIAVAVISALTLAGCGGDDTQPDAQTPKPTTQHFSLEDVDVRGLTVEAAKARLAAHGWSDDASEDSGGEYFVHPQAPQWIICSQRFSPLANGRRDLTLDAAPRCGEVVMPDLIGKTFAEAEEAAEALGMTVFEESIVPDNGGVVCYQSPPPGPFRRVHEDTVFVDLEYPSCS